MGGGGRRSFLTRKADDKQAQVFASLSHGWESKQLQNGRRKGGAGKVYVKGSSPPHGRQPFNSWWLFVLCEHICPKAEKSHPYVKTAILFPFFFFYEAVGSSNNFFVKHKHTPRGGGGEKGGEGRDWGGRERGAL